MRSSTILIIVAVSAAAPSFAAPAYGVPSASSSTTPRIPDLDEESGALSLQDVKDFGNGFVDGFTKTLGTFAPLAGLLLRREAEPNARVPPVLLTVTKPRIKTVHARQDQTLSLDDESGALSLDDIKHAAGKVADTVGPIAKAAAPFISLFLREESAFDSEDESGALSWDDVKQFGEGFVDGFTNTIQKVTPAVSAVGELANAVSPLLSHSERRELIARATLQARQDQGLDESGALSFDDIKEGAEKVAHTVAPIAQAVAPFIKLFLRDLPNAGSRALSTTPDGLNVDESGALSFDEVKQSVEKVAQTVAPVAQAVAPFVKLFLRDLSSSVPNSPAQGSSQSGLDLDESGALSFDDIKEGAKKVFDTVAPIAKTVAPFVEAVAPLLLRDLHGVDLSTLAATRTARTSSQSSHTPKRSVRSLNDLD